ncbi:unnamed protein product [Adineta steineri]|uniref:G-protein coupled receptors family 1 profile domain-containing protein n=1 Tax=Adineta steineri TaxID=433720 RepID=A0A814JVR8_9BILA|nr:unnamed protein product [Adineta steineri]CAF1104270.1 unnamed protein product [Adineta steineri]
MSSDIDRALYIFSISDDLYITFGLFVIIITTIGNLCNCFVFFYIPPLNKHPNALFLISTSIGSLLFINTGLWTIIIRILTGIDYMNRSLFWCKTNAWLTYSGGCFSFMCNCFAGFCQFLILLPNTEWLRLITRTRAKLIIISIAIIYLLIFIPIPIYNTNFQPSSATYVCKSSFQIINVYSNYWIIIGYYFMPALLTLLLFTLIWYNFQQFLRRRHCIEGVVTRMILIQMSSILISGIPAAEEIVAPISKNEMYLDYVKQATVGILMGGLRVVATQQKLTPNESLAVFFHPSNTDSLNIMNDLLRKYIQTCCDEFCWIYDDVYIKTTIPLKEALDLNGAHYIFSHFNKIFQNTRSNLTPGPKHLNCLAMCTAINYMPLLFSTISTQYKEHCLVGTRSSHDGNWSEAEKNVVRVILQELVQKSIDWLNTNKQEELKKIPFVCQEDDSCNQNWDLFNFSQNKRVIAVANIKKLWSELEQ